MDTFGMSTPHNTPEPGDALLTMKEAAHVAYLSTQTLKRYADKGLIPTYRTPTNHRRFRRADVEALLKPQG